MAQSSFDALVASCPPQWVKQLKPFLLRASEFKQRQPAVSYYLKTYVAFMAMKLRAATGGGKSDDKDSKEATRWLMTLLSSLESEKSSLPDSTSDGRTSLTRTALMLFTRADDMERSGQASEAVVRLFFSASQLFEATRQFTDNGELDPIAAEKAKYAKYTAAAIKRALDKKVPYVSPNPQESPTMVEDALPPLPPQPAASSADPLPQQPPAAPNYEVPQKPQQQPQPYQPPPPQPQYPPHQQYPPNPPQQVQDPYSYDPTPPPPQYFSPPQPQPQYPPPQQPQQHMYQPQPQPQPPPLQQQFQHHPPPGAPPVPPSMDAMLESQKFAKQAVSALQFYDWQNAKAQLKKALSALGD